ncbi:MAG: hypothetical protein WA880_16635 [Ornithinimicrobium sp.]
MTGNTSNSRAAAMGRASRAVARLDGIEAIEEPVWRQRAIVNDAQKFSDREAWDAVSALEEMLMTRGIVNPAQAAAERAEAETTNAP